MDSTRIVRTFTMLAVTSLAGAVIACAGSDPTGMPAAARPAKKPAGQACHVGGKGDSTDCEDQLYCAWDATHSYTGTCTPKAKVGGACTDQMFSCEGEALFLCKQGVCVAEPASPDSG